jgi:hypothetical protein
VHVASDDAEVAAEIAANVAAERRRRPVAVLPGDPVQLRPLGRPRQKRLRKLRHTEESLQAGEQWETASLHFIAGANTTIFEFTATTPAL